MSSLFLMKTPKSQLTPEEPLTKKRLGPTQKDILHPKTRKKPREDSRRGICNITKLHIPWCAFPKLENNDITEVLPKELEIHAPRQAPQAGALAPGRGAPQSTWHGRLVGFDHRNSTLLEEIKTPPLEDTHKVLCTIKSRGKRQ